MLASALPPPPELAVHPGEKIDKQKKREKKCLRQEKGKKDPLMHRERGPHSIYATFARLKFALTLKIRPYKLGRCPLQGLRPGAMAPPCPPPLGTPLRVGLLTTCGCCLDSYRSSHVWSHPTYGPTTGIWWTIVRSAAGFRWYQRAQRRTVFCKISGTEKRIIRHYNASYIPRWFSIGLLHN